MNGERFAERLAWLARLAAVPSALLGAIVRRDGACMYATAEIEPGWRNAHLTDAALAAELCAGCLVQDECLELELREAGPDTTGVFGALPETERRELYRHWLSQRASDSKGGPQE